MSGFGVADVCSFQRLSTSGVVGDSGKAIDVLGYSIKSGGTAGNISLFNSTAAGAATGTFAWADQARAVSIEQTIPLSFPIRLGLGCYVSFDGNVSAVTVFYRQMLS
jgi:hypothetical protein